MILMDKYIVFKSYILNFLKYLLSTVLLILYPVCLVLIVWFQRSIRMKLLVENLTWLTFCLESISKKIARQMVYCSRGGEVANHLFLFYWNVKLHFFKFRASKCLNLKLKLWMISFFIPTFHKVYYFKKVQT